LADETADERLEVIFNDAGTLQAAIERKVVHVADTRITSISRARTKPRKFASGR
jgi:hypothetical protein